MLKKILGLITASVAALSLLTGCTTANTTSGSALVSVSKVKQFYKIKTEDIIVIYDDIDIPFETIRYRTKGSAGSHNGMKDIIKAVGGEEFSRIRIGLGGLKHENQDLKDFVLQRFSKEQLEKLDNVFESTEEKLREFLQTKKISN